MERQWTVLDPEHEVILLDGDKPMAFASYEQAREAAISAAQREPGRRFRIFRAHDYAICTVGKAEVHEFANNDDSGERYL